jgi:glycosyltransferase involved in cell wall biosynthesis
VVSVVIPCYNQAHFLGEAIESALAQSYPHLEIVVVDDGSTDNTAVVAARYPGVRCVRQMNQGLAAARNTGLHDSTGSYLVFLDSDDRLLPGAVAAGLAVLHAHPECAFASGLCQYIAADGTSLPTPTPTPLTADYYSTLLRHTHIWMPAMVMHRRTVFEAVGGFDPSVNPCADYDLYLRVAQKYPICSHQEVVAEYRRHGSNMTNDPALMLRSVATVLKRQRQYVKRNRRYAEAYRAGAGFWYGWYGKPLVAQILSHTVTRKWARARDGMVVLLRDPVLLLQAAVTIMLQRMSGQMPRKRTSSASPSAASPTPSAPAGR